MNIIFSVGEAEPEAENLAFLGGARASKNP